MVFRAVIAIAAALLIVSGSVADAAGTVALTKLAGKPQSFSGAQLVLKSSKLLVTLPDKRERDFAQASCTNTVEIMQCQPVAVTVRIKGSAHDLNVTDGIGYFNVTKVPQTIPTTPPAKLARGGLFITPHTDEGTSITIRGTLDAGAAALTAN